MRVLCMSILLNAHATTYELAAANHSLPPAAIQVSEGDQQNNYVALLGNILFPLLAFGGLFFLFGRGQNGQSGGGGGGPFGGMGGGGPMDFGKSKSKFQEVPETGVSFDDVAVRDQINIVGIACDAVTYLS